MKGEEQLRKDDERYIIYDLKGKEVTMSTTYLRPLQSTLGHKHNWEETYYIVDGQGKIRLGSRTIRVKPRQFILVPQNVYHRLFNESTIFPLEFTCAWGRICK